jgi:4'-phosphopantetheinyl transferase
MIADEHWPLPPEGWAACDAEVHLWLAELEQPEHTLQRLTGVLAGDELVRAQRFRFERDRRHFIVARGVLRSILSRYLQILPEEVQFEYGLRGKPTLATGCGDGRLRFNLSHSHELALYAVTYDRELGVDIECMRPLDDAESIATHFFSAREQKALRDLPTHLKHQGFFNCWTRKEACIKATGEGLYQSLDGFDVSLAPGEPAQLLAVLGKPDEVRRWTLRALQPPAGYAAALAVEGSGWRLRCWQWEEMLAP